MKTDEQLRQLPAVHEVLDELGGRYPHALAVAEIRRALDTARASLRSGDPVPPILEQVRRTLDSLAAPSLRPVINATGVVLHTNLGRAPLDAAALAGYSNLEYDLAAGRRGKRDNHIAPLLERLAGAPGIAVNNNAAAVYLALNELAAGGEVIVSRGELIEIGDGFRIPDIMQRSGAILREVGTTNRTRVEDYAEAISDRTRLLMIVHPSNFRMQGFTAKPERGWLVALARERGLPLYEDLGSGCIADLRPSGIDEPRVQDAVADGVDLVSFSGDKLLGGPQAGILCGRQDLVARLRRNPMFRALRLDKLITAALEQTLRNLLFERWDNIPALRMIRATPESIRDRAVQLLARTGIRAEVLESRSVIGGGSTPEQAIPTWVIALPGDARKHEGRLRASQPPVIARIENDRLLIDLRTVEPAEEALLERALCAL